MIKTCVICKSETNKFPLFPFDNYPGWCHKCIQEEMNLQFKLKQESGCFLRLRDLMIELENGVITKEEFERQKQLLFTNG